MPTALLLKPNPSNICIAWSIDWGLHGMQVTVVQENTRNQSWSCFAMPTLNSPTISTRVWSFSPRPRTVLVHKGVNVRFGFSKGDADTEEQQFTPSVFGCTISEYMGKVLGLPKIENPRKSLANILLQVCRLLQINEVSRERGRQLSTAPNAHNLLSICKESVPQTIQE